MGGALGLAVLSTIASTQTRGETGVAVARAITDGFDLAFTVAAVFAFAGAAVAATRLRARTASEVVPLAPQGELEEQEALAA